jgi:hypothetical protein
MKKVNFKKVLMALSIALTFLFLGVEQASAQSLSNTSGSGLYALPQADFVSVAEAQVLLEAKLVELKADLGTPGLPQSLLNAMLKEYNFYGMVDSEIKNGNTVPKAILAATFGIQSDAHGAVPAVAQQLRDDVVDLLSN